MRLDDLLEKYYEFRGIIAVKASKNKMIAEKIQETEVQIHDYEKDLCEIKKYCKENEECIKVLKEQTAKNEAE